MESKVSREDTPSDDATLIAQFGGPSENKAGLLRDKQQVRQIIYEASKGSKYFEAQKQKDERLKDQVAQAKSAVESHFLKFGSFAYEQSIFDAMAQDAEKTRDLSKVIAVIDADAFFASCEELRTPELKGKPFVVGGGGISCTSSYEARKYGVRSAMPLFICKKLCPDLMVVKTDFDLYKKRSEEIQEVVKEFDPDFRPASLDEVYCDLTDYIDSSDLDAGSAVSLLREKIYQKTGLTVSAGVGPNALIAKIAADINKPNGQYLVGNDRSSVLDFIQDMPVRRLYGVGQVTERKLAGIGVNQVRDIFDKRGEICLTLKGAALEYIVRSYLGLGDTEISSKQDRKSYGVEHTFAPSTDMSKIWTMCEDLSHQLHDLLVDKHVIGQTLTLKVKWDTFKTTTKSASLGDPFNDYETIRRLTHQLYASELSASKNAVRLLGLRLTHVVSLNTADIHNLATYFQGKEKMQCPICERTFSTSEMGLSRHIDRCLGEQDESNSAENPSSLETKKYRERSGDSSGRVFSKKTKIGDFFEQLPVLQCPLCGEEKKCSEAAMTVHVDHCLKKQEERSL